MPAFHLSEVELIERLYKDPALTALGVDATISAGVGITLSQHGRPVGWWYVAADKLCYSSFAGASPPVLATGTDHAIAATVSMARSGLWRQPRDAYAALTPV